MGHDRSIWGDNWWIEGDQAWFVLDRVNILCCLDLRTNECEMAVCVPMPNGKSIGFSKNPFCIKQGDDVYCMPGYGDRIWIYETSGHTFASIGIDADAIEALSLGDFWEHDGRLFAVSLGLRQILEIDTVKKKIARSFSIGGEKSIAGSVRGGNAIYILADLTNRIYRFDLISKEMTVYGLPDIGRKLNTIGYDGERFWLSGYSREIYIWDPERNDIRILDDLPAGFGICDLSEGSDGRTDTESRMYDRPAFSHCTVAGRYAWFIPYQTNAVIYVDREQCTSFMFEIPEEIEDKESIAERTDARYKYNLEYVRDDRYIGLFSVKNDCILEIDALGLSYVYKDYGRSFEDKALIEYIKVYRKGCFRENKEADRRLYRRWLRIKDPVEGSFEREDVGKGIYDRMAGQVLETEDR